MDLRTIPPSLLLLSAESIDLLIKGLGRLVNDICRACQHLVLTKANTRRPFPHSQVRAEQDEPFREKRVAAECEVVGTTQLTGLDEGVFNVRGRPLPKIIAWQKRP
jgi:hypothetical protein